jgi:hypothetical protein
MAHGPCGSITDCPPADSGWFGGRHAEEHGQAILRLRSEEETIPAVREMTDAGRVYHREWVTRTFAPQPERIALMVAVA